MVISLKTGIVLIRRASCFILKMGEHRQFYHYIPRKNMLEDLCEAALSIKLNQSLDSEWSDHHVPDKEKDLFKLKCFRCYGNRDPHCRQCLGTENVSNTHPLAILLGQVLERRLQLPTSGGKVCPIKEQEEEGDERRATCVVFLNGSKDEQERCSEQLNPSIDGSNCWQVQISISGCQIFKEDTKRCHHCNGLIENCYSACKTCMAEGQAFWLCDQCSDSHCFTHPAHHNIEPVIDYDELKDNKIETISQQFEDESHENDFLQEIPLTLDKKNSSIANYLQDDSSNILNCSERVEKTEEHSRVQFEIDGLFSSFDFKSTQKMSKQPQSSKGRTKTKFMKENMENISEDYTLPPPRQSQTKMQPNNQHQNYVFVDYKCDFCDTQPILNVRYHCKVCEDYDLCENCYEDCDSIHECHGFEKVDGRLMREKAMEKLFQVRDPNLRATCLVKERDLKATFYPSLRETNKIKSVHFKSQLLPE